MPPAQIQAVKKLKLNNWAINSFRVKSECVGHLSLWVMTVLEINGALNQRKSRVICATVAEASNLIGGTPRKKLVKDASSTMFSPLRSVGAGVSVSSTTSRKNMTKLTKSRNRQIWLRPQTIPQEIESFLKDEDQMKV